LLHSPPRVVEDAVVGLGWSEGGASVGSDKSGVNVGSGVGKGIGVSVGGGTSVAVGAAICVAAMIVDADEIAVFWISAGDVVGGASLPAQETSASARMDIINRVRLNMIISVFTFVLLYTITKVL